MKIIKKLSFLFVLFALGATIGCKKEQKIYSKGFESFKIILTDATNVPHEYVGTITGGEIVIQLPIETDVTTLKPIFKTDNARTIVQVGSVVQESGITQQDLSKPVTYQVKAEDRSTQTYTVRVEKKVSLRSFGFFKEDNPTLTGDYVGVIRGLQVNVAVPESVDLTKLVARFETNQGATLKVAGVLQESKKTVNNFSSAVIYSFSDPSLTAAVDYNVTISFLGPQWIMIGDESIIVPTASGIKMAFDPFTKLPYFVYQRTGKDEAGIDIPTDNRKLAVIRYTGTGWESVGPSTGITSFRADNANISFDANGSIYVGYLDYTNSENKSSVIKYTNGAWSTFSTPRFSLVKNSKQTFTLGEADMPITAMVSNSTDVPKYPRNNLFVTGYTNGAWADITQLTMAASFVHVFKGLDGKSYMAILERSPARADLYKMVNGVWQPVGPTSFSTTDNALGYTSIYGAVDANGVAYVVYQNNVSSQRNNRVLKFNGTAWVELGTAGSSQDQTDKYNLAIHPDGTVFFAYANTSGLYSRTFNTTTNNWNTPRQIISGKVNGFDMQISPDGTPYVAASLTSTNKTVVYKYALSK